MAAADCLRLLQALLLPGLVVAAVVRTILERAGPQRLVAALVVIQE